MAGGHRPLATGHVATGSRPFPGEAYQVDVRSRTRAAVASALVKFSGLLYELGLSPHDDEVFTIKVEIDTNPPAGARTETRLVRRFVMLNLLLEHTR